MFATTQAHFQQRDGCLCSPKAKIPHTHPSPPWIHVCNNAGKNHASSHTNFNNSVARLRAEQRLTHFVSLCNKAAMISLLAFCGYYCENSVRGKPSIALSRILLPTQTRFVTPGSTELHFYSGRHVRDRVRLHLRRVTENNNRERTRETTTENISSADSRRTRTEMTGRSRNAAGRQRRFPTISPDLL